MSEKKAVDIWLEAAYKLFAEVGPGAMNIKALSELSGITRTNFYYHFADMEDLIDRLLNEHLEVEMQEYSKNLQMRLTKFIPDLYNIVAENKQAIRFHWQLFRHREDIKYNQVFLYMRKKNSALIIPKVMDYYKLDLPPFLIESIWDTVNDAWFANLDFDNFTSEYMSKLGNEIMLSVLAFAKHRT